MGTSIPVGNRLSAWIGKVSRTASPGVSEKSDELSAVPVATVSSCVGEESMRRHGLRVAWPLLTRRARSESVVPGSILPSPTAMSNEMSGALRTRL